MTAAYTPGAVRTIRKNAGRVPAAMIADALQWSVDRLRRIATTHGIALELPASPIDRETLAPFEVRVSLPDRRSEYFTVRLRPADARILRAKAEARFTNPSRLLAEIFEGAIARGKVDELATAAQHYRPADEGGA